MSEFVNIFRNEIAEVNNERMKEFLVESLALIPDLFLDARVESKSFADYTKKVFEITNHLCDMLDAEDYARDVLLTVALIQDMTRFDVHDGIFGEDPFHPLTVRARLFSLQGIIGRDDFDNLMRVIEGSHGFKSPIPQVAPQINDPIHLWVIPIASYLATKESA